MNIDDNELKAHLQRVDPAASLSPLSPSRFTELKDSIMTDTITPPVVPATPRKRASTRVRAAWVIAGGLAAVGVGALVIPALSAGPGPVTQLAGPVVDPMASTLKCAEVTPASLQEATLAFEATVVSVAKDGTVTLDVSDTFKGTVNDTVEVANGNPEISDGGGVMYEQGKTYLLASDGEYIYSCGQSGIKNAELQDLYQQAYGK
ncbi:MAG: hypothetical protein ACOH1T_06955 [Microbacteriaceae bacterium]